MSFNPINIYDFKLETFKNVTLLKLISDILKDFFFLKYHIKSNGIQRK